MALRLDTASDYEKYFKTLRDADWNTQYLTSSGEVRSKCFCSILALFLRILKISFIRGFVSPDIHNARYLIRNRVKAYYAISGKSKSNDKLNELFALDALKKVNQLFQKINSRRPANGLAPLPKKTEFRVDKYESEEGLRQSGLQRKQSNSSSTKTSVSSPEPSSGPSSFNRMPALYASQLSSSLIGFSTATKGSEISKNSAAGPATLIQTPGGPAAPKGPTSEGPVTPGEPFGQTPGQ